MEIEYLERAPIQEAILDFRVGFGFQLKKEDFEALSKELEPTYPKQDELHRHSAQMNFEGATHSVIQSTVFGGVKYQSIDDKFVVQAQIDGLTISRLYPYAGWGSLVGETRRVWGLFVKYLKPVSLERIACRYINRFEVPVGNFDFSDYLVSAPEVPNGLPQGVSRYFLQQEIPTPEFGSSVLLTQTLELALPQAVVFILDIDAFKLSLFDVNGEGWWTDLENLRQLKNQFFFGSITDKAKDLFR